MNLKFMTFLFTCILFFLGTGSVFGAEPEVKKEFYDSGKLKSETHYKNGKKEGQSTFWYQSGEHIESHYENGKKEGLETHYRYSSGGKWSETHYKNGKREGLETHWYSSEDGKTGIKSSERNYKNGEREGVETEWYESGEKKSKSHSKNGYEDGLSIIWYESGEKEKESNYKNGKKDGLEITWNDIGERYSETHYQNGKQLGLTKTLQTFECEFEEDKFVGGKTNTTRCTGEPELRLLQEDYCESSTVTDPGYYSDRYVNVNLGTGIIVDSGFPNGKTGGIPSDIIFYQTFKQSIYDPKKRGQSQTKVSHLIRYKTFIGESKSIYIPESGKSIITEYFIQRNHNFIEYSSVKLKFGMCREVKHQNREKSTVD
jgi:antitoxin component YwqK of YwqJK toxin-antitoxin module